MPAPPPLSEPAIVHTIGVDVSLIFAVACTVDFGLESWDGMVVSHFCARTDILAHGHPPGVSTSKIP
jgi:hypothetical protein